MLDDYAAKLDLTSEALAGFRIELTETQARIAKDQGVFEERVDAALGVLKQQNDAVHEELVSQWKREQAKTAAYIEELEHLAETLDKRRRSIAQRQAREDRANGPVQQEVDQWGLPIDPHARAAELARRSRVVSG